MMNKRFAVLSVMVVGLVLILALLMTAPAIGQGLETRTPFGILFTNGEWATMTPVPSVTPTSTATATATATASPTATFTAIPASATPTVEVIPETPGPTAEPASCEIKLAGFAINLRVTPGGSWIKTLPAGSAQTLYQFKTASPYLYAFNGEGWFVVREGLDWWIVGYEGRTEPCQDLPGWPAGVEPPAPVVVNPAGLQLLVDAVESTTYPMFPVLSNIKTVQGSEKLGAAFKATSPGGTWVYRGIGHDNPSMVEWYEPAYFISAVQGEWSLGADYYEIINEVVPPSWPLFVNFTITVLDYASTHNTCILWGSFGPGNPDYGAWAYLVDIIEWADQHPCGRNSDGSLRYHGIAVHMPLFMPDDIPRQEGWWIDSEHVAGRLDWVDDLVQAYTGVGLSGHRSGNVYVTEAGIDDGYSGSWNDRWSCEDRARSFWLTVNIYMAKWPFVKGIEMWTWGNGRSVWTDAQWCYPAFLAYK